ncbi:MAG TPA: phosphoribosylpyrophosphate synthetase [Ruminococcaceae bacterium]|nr:phosphoribosylpyrophosphate synthetase [Oscillospiraceae bacterium]
MSNIDFKHTPYGDLAIVSMKGCEDISSKVDYYLKQWRDIPEDETFVIGANCPRFGTGEAKAVLNHTARGLDAFIICDCFNYNVTYKMYGQTVPMSPDDHFQDLKRVIAAFGGKARRITVIMPMLYEGRQHRRTSRESMDCAMALQELVAMGVKNIITFDAHDPRVNNAIPLDGFDNVQAAYQMIKALLKAVPGMKLNKENAMIVSPDEGGMGRCIYYSSVLGLDLGMFYKRRNYSVIVNGRNPIEAHEFLGNDITGKDLILVDDMISSGDSMLDIAKKLKEKGARRIFVFATFGLFVEGLEKFDEYYKDGLIDKVFTTNLIYQTPELLSREWYVNVNMSKYIALLVETLNKDNSISSLLDPADRIKKIVAKYNAG